MAKQPEQQSEKIDTILVKCIIPRKEEGYYSFSEIEIPKSILEKHGKVVYKSEYDIMAIMLDQVNNKVLDILGL